LAFIYYNGTSWRALLIYCNGTGPIIIISSSGGANFNFDVMSILSEVLRSAVLENDLASRCVLSF
jgi:hypothetical protein